MLQRLFAQYLPPEVVGTLKAVGAAALVLVALLIVARAISRWRPSSVEAEATNEERDFVFDAERAWKLLLAWLRRLLGGGAPPRALDTAAAAPATSATDAGQLSAVRALYRHLLRLGEAAGARRAVATTPLEHLASLERSLEPAGELAQITDAYLRARYAEFEASETETVALRDDLGRIRPIGAPD